MASSPPMFPTADPAAGPALRTATAGDDARPVFAPPAPVLLPVVGSTATFPVHRIYCVGRNYVDHAVEMGHTGREPPFFFMKPADAALPVPAGSVGRMHYPPLTASLHHEIELVVALGRGGRDIAVADAPAHVWGYAVGLDMTRRDLQNAMKKQGRPWCIGKAFEESAPVGPVVPAARCGELRAGAIRLEVDGVLRQQGDLSQLIWNVAETIAELSRAWTLQPGDLVFTGTPAGVAAVERGQTLRGSIDGLGALEVQVV